jgi:hypothetical protein
VRRACCHVDLASLPRWPPRYRASLRTRSCSSSFATRCRRWNNITSDGPRSETMSASSVMARLGPSPVRALTRVMPCACRAVEVNGSRTACAASPETESCPSGRMAGREAPEDDHLHRRSRRRGLRPRRIARFERACGRPDPAQTGISPTYALAAGSAAKRESRLNHHTCPHVSPG